MCLFLAVLAGFTVTLGVAVSGAVAGHHVQLDSFDGLVVIDRATGWFARAQAMFGAVGVPFLALGVARQAVAWRRSSGERRQQLKWLASGVAGGRVALVFGLASPGSASGAAWAFANVVSFCIVALPVSIGVAILRYRLYDIDRIISRTLAYAIVTGLLVGVYAGLVLLATQVLAVKSARSRWRPRPWQRQHCSARCGGGCSSLVDRGLNRARYDADQTVAAFAARLKDAVHLDSVSDDLAGVVNQSLEPAHISVWISHRD